MAHPGCNVRCQGVPNRLALLLHSCFIETSPTVEKAVTCYEVNRLVASLPQHSVVICSTQSLCCRGSTLRMRPQTGVCEPEQSQQCELSGPTFRFTMQGFSMVGGYLKDFEKTTKLSKLRGGALAWVWALARTVRCVAFTFDLPTLSLLSIPCIQKFCMELIGWGEESIWIWPFGD